MPESFPSHPLPVLSVLSNFPQVWTTAGTNVTLALAEGFNLFGILAAVATGGMAAPAFLITGGINSVAVVPATCRLFLMMSCDLTFVLARSFKEVTFRQGGQPAERDVLAAARNYRLRGYSQHVHNDIKKLVPRRNMAASYKADEIAKEIDAIILRYKDKLSKYSTTLDHSPLAGLHVLTTPSNNSGRRRPPPPCRPHAHRLR